MRARTRRGPRRSMLPVAAGATSIVLLIALPLTDASADPKPVFPSSGQVQAAKDQAAATGSQVAALQAQYQSASAHLDDVQTAAASAGEAYNGAKVLLDQRTAAAEQARAESAAAQQRSDSAHQAVRSFASLAYQQNGSLGDVAAFLSDRGPQDLVDRATALDTMGQLRAEAYAEADSASELADTAKRNAAIAAQQQQAAADAAQRAKAAAEAQANAANAEAVRIQQEQTQTVARLAVLQKTSVGLEQARQEGLRQQAIAEAAAREAARQARIAEQKAAVERSRKAAQEAARAKAAADLAARQAAQAAANARALQRARSLPKRTTQPAPRSSPQRAASSSRRTPPRYSPPPAPARGGVSAVLAYARAQLGKWYLWGASGPNQFDCSGLTMMAWRQAGVYLGHYTGSQYSQTSRVSISDLRPGDLVFYGTSGPSSHHVGLYVGSGQMVEAPHTGAQVRYASIYRSDLLPYGGRP